MSQLSVSGNLTALPELRYTPGGQAVITFRVAENTRKRGTNGEGWVDGPTYFHDVEAWGPLAENIAESFPLGNERVIVAGRLEQDRYEDKDGNKRTSWQIKASSVGPDLLFATANVTKARRQAEG